MLDTTNGHDKQVVDNFNQVAKNFDDSGLLLEILSRWADDEDLKSITEHLKDRIAENEVIKQEIQDSIDIESWSK